MSDPYIKLAYSALEKWVRENSRIKPPDDIPEEMLEKKNGVFVSLKKNGELRGCMGTFEPTQENVAREIIKNAISASSRDPRFPPLQNEEIEDLEISVDILSSPQPCSRDQLDPTKYGVIVKKGRRKGLLLPDLEGVDTVKEQLSVARRKAGISKGEEERILRFEVERHKE